MIFTAILAIIICWFCVWDPTIRKINKKIKKEEKLFNKLKIEAFLIYYKSSLLQNWGNDFYAFHCKYNDFKIDEDCYQVKFKIFFHPKETLFIAKSNLYELEIFKNGKVVDLCNSFQKELKEYLLKKGISQFKSTTFTTL